MQIVKADRSLWRGIPGRWSAIIMAVVAGAFAISTGLIAGVVAYLLLGLVRWQFKWFPERPAWGFLTLVLVPVSRIAFWLSLAFLLFGFWRQGLFPVLGLPLFFGWRLAIMLIERNKFSFL
ncbi:MAG: hypothetical protein Q7O66_16240 [Dehalococcoidia bacterium]|nr:hypothetical protein [Dehalococcoidia bacterium]